MDKLEYYETVMGLAYSGDFEIWFYPLGNAGIGFKAMINCNDLFYWGCADAEPIEVEDIPLLEQATEDSEYYGDLLFCARKRKMRPQGAYYQQFNEEDAALFNAAGPKRETGYGNPKDNTGEHTCP